MLHAPMFIAEVTNENDVALLQIAQISSITPNGPDESEIRMANGDTFFINGRPDQVMHRIRTGASVSVALESGGEGH